MARDLFWTVVVVLGILGCLVLLPLFMVLGIIVVGGVGAYLIYAYIHDTRIAQEEWDRQQEEERLP